MEYTILKSKTEFQTDYLNKVKKFDERKEILHTLEKQHPKGSFTFKGFSITAEAEVDFKVDWVYSNGEHVNWRERLICPKTKLNNRIRFAYHALAENLKTQENETIYITEQLTPFYDFLIKKYSNLTGSEYINSDLTSGELNSKGVRHEDFTNLSFSSNSLDKILSFDCLEHIPNYMAALKEAFRTLKPGGQVLMSFPFDANRDAHLVRAIINENGEVEHLTEPEYHGDPINDKGCLSFYNFGWDILKDLESLGFSNPHALTSWSDKFGYLGDEQILFVANKPNIIK